MSFSGSAPFRDYLGRSPGRARSTRAEFTRFSAHGDIRSRMGRVPYDREDRANGSRFHGGTYHGTPIAEFPRIIRFR